MLPEPDSVEHGLAALISPEAESLYDGLISAGGLSVGDEGLDLRSHAFRELFETDLAYPDPNDLSRIQVVPRKTALQLLLAKHHDEMISRYADLERGWRNLKALLDAATAEGSKEDHAVAPVVLMMETESEEINRLSVEFYLSARRDLRSTMLGSLITPLREHQLVTPPAAALRVGARFRTLYDREYAEKPAGEWIIQRSIEAGEQARVHPFLPAQLLHVDDRVALVSLGRLRELGALLVRSPSLLALIAEWFDCLWQLAPSSRADMPGEELTPTHRAVLRLLASGMTDEAIARALGTSVRTVRRSIGALLEVLDVETRFAAGAAAVKRGWI